MTTDNKATFRRFDDAVNSGDLEAVLATIDEISDPDLVFHAPVPMGGSGVTALKQAWTGLMRAYPDIHVAVQDMLTDGDKIVVRNTVTGTNTGEFRGLPPTGKPVTYNEIFIIRFAAGLMAEIWGVVDVYAQLKQLGIAAGADHP
jgi:predicted ester cyclase